MGVAAVVNFAKTGKKVSGYTDTGVNLIAAKAVPGVQSKSVAYGLGTAGARRPVLDSGTGASLLAPRSQPSPGG